MAIGASTSNTTMIKAHITPTGCGQMAIVTLSRRLDMIGRLTGGGNTIMASGTATTNT
jgi:hypothetical protein